MSHKYTNRLIAEKSPYLLQHAHNPVDWYPWGDEAFDKAREERRPIFLSIGYSTCHWCHVMERESFENEVVAELLNRHYVSIKVDREERPDVDRVYMAAVQLQTGAGGWPLSAWLTPDLEPYYTGTYFPPSSAHGRPGFSELLQRLAEVWQNQRDKAVESSRQLAQALRRMHTIEAASEEGVQSEQLVEQLAERACLELERSFDPSHGGFGDAPKFPRPATLFFLFRHARYRQLTAPAKIALETLDKMWRGGINDHLGGGFHRYSVDRYWRVAHFEKMLYDQAQLTHAYLDAFLSTGLSFYGQAASEILGYVERDMRSPDGGFFSAEDADSAPDRAQPGHKLEGAFYLWRREELEEILGAGAAAFCERYGVSVMGNTLSDPHGEFGVGNVLFAAREIEDLAEELRRDASELEAELALARGSLLAQRSKRPRPGLDDKMITAWNGMMISAFARAARVLQNYSKPPEYLEVAESAANAVLTHSSARTESGALRLHRRHRDGEARFEGQLDDYANLGVGFLDLFETTGKASWLELAIETGRALIELFYDPDDGAFYDSPPGDASVLVRTKEAYDGAEPSGNAVASYLLARLARWLENRDWSALAEGVVRRHRHLTERQASAAPFLIGVAELLRQPPSHLVICGRASDRHTQELLEIALAAPWNPARSMVVVEDGDQELRQQIPLLAGLSTQDDRSVAYLCENYSCQLPTSDPEELRKKLS